MKTKPLYILKRAFDSTHANQTPQYLIQLYRWTGTTVDWATVTRDKAIKLPLKEAQRIANLQNLYLKQSVRVVIETA